ncbi:uncharacterized protein [Apostichopus japonicus]|uniref:uncharacterized protein isoform X1 n=1 Tax=Stichopus japonicus TaxID=307972 RepID=UPI003AB385C9
MQVYLCLTVSYGICSSIETMYIKTWCRRFAIVVSFICLILWIGCNLRLDQIFGRHQARHAGLSLSYRLLNESAAVNMTKSASLKDVTPREECHVVHSKLNTCNKLPNYFLHESRQRDFNQSIINFWHIQKAGGSTVAHCMMNMIKQAKLPPTFHGNSNCKAKLEMVERSSYFSNLSIRHPIIRGHGTLGLCDFIHEKITKRNCSNFAVFRDPLDRAVSHYFFNRQIASRKGKTYSGYAKALNNNITEWMKLVGSVTLHGFANEWLFEERGNSQEICKQQRSSIASGWRLVDGFLQSIIDNMDRHFSVIGIMEDLETTYEILEEVYGLPFTKTCPGLHVMKGIYDNTTHMNQKTLKEDAKRQLMEDEEIMNLLQFDILLYQRAKEIFYQQKKILEKYKQLYK